MRFSTSWTLDKAAHNWEGCHWKMCSRPRNVSRASATEWQISPGDKLLVLLPSSSSKLVTKWKRPFVVTWWVGNIQTGVEPHRYITFISWKHGERPKPLLWSSVLVKERDELGPQMPRLPEHKSQIFQRELAEMLKIVLIVLVVKKGRSICFCVNYCKLDSLVCKFQGKNSVRFGPVCQTFVWLVPSASWTMCSVPTLQSFLTETQGWVPFGPSRYGGSPPDPVHRLETDRAGEEIQHSGERVPGNPAGGGLSSFVPLTPRLMWLCQRQNWGLVQLHQQLRSDQLITAFVIEIYGSSRFKVLYSFYYYYYFI